MSLFNELKRRNVFRVGLAYLAGAWLLIQILETLLPIFGLPETSARTIVIIVAVGFIPVLILSWLFEITPEGIVRDADAGHAIGTRSTRIIDRGITVLLVLAVAYFAVDKFLLDPARDASLVEFTAQQARTDALTGSYGDRSIAVLPFVDMSAEGDQQYFSYGIAEELLNLLARIPELRVVSRSSAFQFRGDAIDIPTVATKLNVANILEGSVRKDGNHVRITAKLIDARSDTQLWSDTFDHTLDDVFALQDEIAARVVDSLKIELPKPVRNVDTTDIETLSLYLRANHIWKNRLDESYALAEEMVEEALRRDPSYLPAWTLLARVYYMQGDRRQRDPDEDTRLLMRRTVDKAASLDPEHPEVLTWRAFIANAWDDDPATSAEFYHRSLAADPTSEITIRTFATFLIHIGRIDEGIVLGEYLVSISPLCKGCYDSLFRSYLLVGRYEAIVSTAESLRAIGMDSNNLRKHTGSAYVLLGEPELALEEISAIDDIYPGDVQKLHVGAMAYYSLGRVAEAEAAFAASADGLGDHHEAEVLAWLGRADEAFDKLSLVDAGCCAIAMDPFLRNLHDDPRWAVLVDKHDIPEFRNIEINLDFLPLRSNVR